MTGSRTDGRDSTLRVARRGGSARCFDFYGLSVVVDGAWPEVVEALALDFAWFARERPPVAPDVEVLIERRTPDFDAFDGAVNVFVTPRNVVYQHGGRTIVDYFGRALSVFDRRSGRLVLQSEDEHLVHEAAYLFLLSRIGEHVDACGLARLHAVGLAGAEGAVALLLPSGGGKSTIAVRALRAEGVRLLSDDSPLLDRRGRLHPFPLRIGVNPGEADGLPAEQLRRIERMEFPPKLVLELRAFADRIETTPQPLRHLVLARRSLGREATLEPVFRRAAAVPLIRESVVGVGLYQGLEFVLQRGWRDALGKVGVARTRAACCSAALRHAQVWRATLGRDIERNWALLEPLVV
jgi:hypothetical protein